MLEQINTLGLALALLAGLTGGAIFLLLIGGLSRRAVVVDPASGERRLAASSLEKMFAPLGARLMRRTNRDELAKQLRWARMSWSPELFRILPLVLAPAGLLLAITLGIVANLEAWQASLIAFAGIAGGYLYPKSKLSGTLRARQKGIATDVPGFISYYARVFSVQRDMGRTFQEMNRRVQEHKRFFDQRGGAMTAELRRRIERSKGRGPYDSDLWLNLEELAAQVPHGLFDPRATVANPDPLVVFATENFDPDLSVFVNWLREAAIQSTEVEPSQLDNQVEMIRDKRYKEQQRAIARMTLQATGYLVLFNFPLLLIAIVAPVVGQLLGE